MIDLFLYMAKVSIATGVLYSFYALLLRKTTFHQLNRFLLLFIIAFSIICPFLDLSFTGSYTLKTNYLWINELDNYSTQGPIQKTEIQNDSLFQIKNFVSLAYLIAVLFLLLRSIGQFRAIFRLKQSALVTLEEDSTVVIYLDNIKNPFSFFKWIFLPMECLNNQANVSVIEHEKVHVKQMHSLDLILSEAYCIIFWFNPFVFLLQKSLKNIHEFIADNQVIRSNKTTIEEYLRLLVSKTEMNISFGITSTFNSLTIKKRIKMITNKKSSKKRSILYFLIVPILALMIQSFSPIDKSSDVPSIRPVKGGEISSKFGYIGINPVTKKQYTHGGIDFKISEGTQVVSSASGVVIEATEKEGWGKLVVIKHEDEYETWYAHLSKINVDIGNKVKLDQEIGLSGNTGYSTGPHLHYEIRKNGERVNPEEYFD